MAAGGAEPVRVAACDAEGAEAAHRDPAQRDAPGVHPHAAADRRDHLADDVSLPVAAAPVVPVGVVAAVREGDHRRAAAQPRQRAEQRVAERGALVTAATVQEDDQRAGRAGAGPGRDHDPHRQPVADGA
jgi:hypothetical protein